MGLEELNGWFSERWFAEHNPDMVRVIIEGGFQDAWMRHCIGIDTYEIPQDITTLKVLYNLDLTVRENSNGLLERVNEDAMAPEDRKTLELNYNYFTRINRVTTIITEDGRVFHDLDLQKPMGSNPNPNQERLSHFFLSLKKHYASFDEAYKSFSEKQKRA